MKFLLPAALFLVFSFFLFYFHENDKNIETDRFIKT